MMNILLAAIVLLPLTTMYPRASDKRPAVRVYVFTAHAESGTPTEDEQGRMDTVRDLRESLNRHSEIALVDSAEAANVTVEITGRERREGAEGGFGGKAMTNFGDCIIRLRVKADGDETEIKGMAPGYWSRAAKDAADRFIKWVQRYRTRVGSRVPLPTTS